MHCSTTLPRGPGTAGGARCGPTRLLSLALLAIVMVVATACGDGGAPEASDAAPASSPPVAGAASSPGTNLFDALDSLQLLEGADHPPFDPAGAALLTWILKGNPIQIERDDWDQDAALTRRAATRLLASDNVEHTTGLHLWTHTAPVDLDLPLGIARLGSATSGPLRPSERAVPADSGRPLPAWRHPRARMPLVWWNHNRRRIELARHRRPEAFTVSYPASLGPFPTEWQWWTELPATPRVSNVTLAPETRRVLGVPAASRLAYPVERLESGALDVGFALTDMGLRIEEGAVRTRRGPEPTAVFAVDVSIDGERERVFQRRVTASEGFGEARVDLAAWKGRACRVEFVVEQATTDGSLFAMWSTPRFRDPVHAAPERPHLLFLDLDTLRADGLSCYGNTRNTSPNIDAWAASEAVLFRDHTSMGNWTLPSTVTMLTGIAPHRHGVFRPTQAMDVRHRPLALRLAELGYETLARTEAGVVTPPGGFDTGFERFVAEPRGAFALARDGWEAELDWLRRRDSARPMFVFLQTYNIHGPFLNDARFDDRDDPYKGPLADEPVRDAHVKAVAEAAGGTLPAREMRYLRDIYDAGVQRVDIALGPLFDALPEIFGDEPYVVVLTSDHGEELFERGATGHGYSLHREQFQTPLIVRAPGLPAGTVIHAPVSSLDLLPTVLALLDVPPDPELRGRDLFADHLAADAARIMQHDGDGIAVQVLDWRLIHDQSDFPRDLGDGLYDLAEDPLEFAPLEELDEPRRKRLIDELRRYRAANPPMGEPGRRGGNEDAALVEQLRQLGYLGDDH